MDSCRDTFSLLPQTTMEVSVEDVYRPGSVLDIPHRPPWSYSMTKQQLDKQEESAFQDYLSRIHSNHHPHELSLFEHNLEVQTPLYAQTTSLTRQYNTQGKEK